MDRQRGGQKKKGNRNQQGSNKSKGGKRPGFVTSKNRFGGNAGAKAKSGRKVNLGKQPGRSNRYYFNLYREERGGRQGGTVNKAKTTTITRTVNDLRQLIRPKVDKTPKTAAKPNVQNKKLSIKKRLGLQSKSARAATVTARRNVMALRIDWSDDDQSSNSVSCFSCPGDNSDEDGSRSCDNTENNCPQSQLEQCSQFEGTKQK